MSKDIHSLIYVVSQKYPKCWSWIAATTFSALNYPEAVSTVFQYALKELSPSTPLEEKLLLARKFRDSLFKGGILYGYPKAINALIELNSVMPDELKEKSRLRDTNVPLSELNRIGQAFFNQTYDTKAESVQTLLRDVYPDLESFSTTLAYGHVYAFTDILNARETSFMLIASLIPLDVPRQIEWHLNNAIKNGASMQEVENVREIAIKVAEFCGVAWRNPVPNVKTQEEQL